MYVKEKTVCIGFGTIHGFRDLLGALECIPLPWIRGEKPLYFLSTLMAMVY